MLVWPMCDWWLSRYRMSETLWFSRRSFVFALGKIVLIILWVVNVLCFSIAFLILSVIPITYGREAFAMGYSFSSLAVLGFKALGARFILLSENLFWQNADSKISIPCFWLSVFTSQCDHVIKVFSTVLSWAESCYNPAISFVSVFFLTWYGPGTLLNFTLIYPGKSPLRCVRWTWSLHVCCWDDSGIYFFRFFLVSKSRTFRLGIPARWWIWNKWTLFLDFK